MRRLIFFLGVTMIDNFWPFLRIRFWKNGGRIYLTFTPTRADVQCCIAIIIMFLLKFWVHMMMMIFWIIQTPVGHSYSKMVMLVHGLTKWTLNKYFLRLKWYPYKYFWVVFPTLTVSNVSCCWVYPFNNVQVMLILITLISTMNIIR